MVTKPFDLIHASLGKELLVATKGGKHYIGILASYDAEANLFLKNVKEVETERAFKKVIIKGGNILSINTKVNLPKRSIKE